MKAPWEDEQQGGKPPHDADDYERYRTEQIAALEARGAGHELAAYLKGGEPLTDGAARLVEVENELGYYRASKWQEELLRLVEQMQRNIKSAFSKAGHIEAIIAQHGASIASPSLLTSRSMVAAIKATAAALLEEMGPAR